MDGWIDGHAWATQTSEGARERTVFHIAVTSEVAVDITQRKGWHGQSRYRTLRRGPMTAVSTTVGWPSFPRRVRERGSRVM